MNATAWIISVTNAVSVAVGEFELVHILPDSPVLFNVPKAPHYCQQVFVWQNKIVPVMNLAVRFGYQEKSVINEHITTSLFAYRAEKTGLIEYGALLLNETPRRYEVSDSKSYPLPAELHDWANYVSCCFKDTETEKIIPILKLEHLFASQDRVTH
jgi:chemotaxis signal transduction protein